MTLVRECEEQMRLNLSGSDLEAVKFPEKPDHDFLVSISAPKGRVMVDIRFLRGLYHVSRPDPGGKQLTKEWHLDLPLGKNTIFSLNLMEDQFEYELFSSSGLENIYRGCFKKWIFIARRNLECFGGKKHYGFNLFC